MPGKNTILGITDEYRERYQVFKLANIVQRSIAIA